MSVARIDLIPFFVVEEGRNIFQSLCHRTPYSGGIGLVPFLRTATYTTTFSATTAFILHWVTVTCPYLSKAFPRQNIADIDGSCCNESAKTVRHQRVIFTKDEVVKIMLPERDRDAKG